MGLSERDQRLIAAVQGGLPFVFEPYRAIALDLGESEEWVLARLKELLANGDIKRFGVVVRHHELGFKANAMVVFDIPDDAVSQRGKAITETGLVTLCYRRPRVPPRWPYNLFCMIHGKDRETVRGAIADIRQLDGMAEWPHAVLFSQRRFKQRGARYVEEP